MEGDSGTYEEGRGLASWLVRWFLVIMRTIMDKPPLFIYAVTGLRPGPECELRLAPCPGGPVHERGAPRPASPQPRATLTQSGALRCVS